MDRKRHRRRLAGKVIALAFFAVVAALIVDRARTIDWPAVLQALHRYETATLLLALALTVLGHLAYSSYELLGRRYAGHRLGTGRVLTIAAVGYACNLNLGALVGGVGFRYRLYSRYNLGTGQIARVIGLSVAANWSGYLLLAGAVFLFAPPALPEDWPLGSTALRGVGVVLLALLAAWLGFCASSRRRDWRIRRVHLRLPRVRLAALMLVPAIASWLAIALVIDRLMPPALPLLLVMGTYYLSTLATLIVRIPGGLGVVEAVFLAVLGARIPPSELLAALLAWRAIYYLLPLLLAGATYLLLEGQARSRRQSAAPRAVPT